MPETWGGTSERSLCEECNGTGLIPRYERIPAFAEDGMIHAMTLANVEFCDCAHGERLKRKLIRERYGLSILVDEDGITDVKS